VQPHRETEIPAKSAVIQSSKLSSCARSRTPTPIQQLIFLFFVLLSAKDAAVIQPNGTTNVAMEKDTSQINSWGKSSPVVDGNTSLVFFCGLCG